MKDIKIPSREITLFVHYARRVVFDSGQYGVGRTYEMFTAVRHVYGRRDPVVHAMENRRLSRRLNYARVRPDYRFLAVPFPR